MCLFEGEHEHEHECEHECEGDAARKYYCLQPKCQMHTCVRASVRPCVSVCVSLCAYLCVRITLCCACSAVRVARNHSPAFLNASGIVVKLPACVRQ